MEDPPIQQYLNISSFGFHFSGKTFNVHLNGTQLIATSPVGRTPPEFVDPADVLTLDGVQRNVITINGMTPGPVIEVMEGAQVK